MRTRIDYSVEVEALEEIVLSHSMTKNEFEFEINRLKMQCNDEPVCDTKTEIVEVDSYDTVLRASVEHITFLRGTTFITFTKTIWRNNND